MRKFFDAQNPDTINEDIASLKELFQDIYEKSTDGMIIMKNHKFKDFNPALVKMFGFDSKDELLNTHIKTLMPKYQESGKHSMREMMKMANITLKNGHNSFEWMFKKKDGTIFWCDIVLTKVHINSQDLIHGIYRDITAKKELEIVKENFNRDLKEQVKKEVEKNRQKDRIMMQQSRLAQMGEIIGMIAHQWRQPLSAISATNSTIAIKAKMDRLTKETILELSDNIDGYVKHLNTTIDDFRNFFKDNKKKENTTLKNIVEDTIKIVKMSLSNANIEMITNLTSEKKIATYTNEVKQVVLNIIKNAQDALIEKNIPNPKIKIQTDDTTITISDNAGGIPQDIIDKIFEPYFSTKTKKDGTGLGLYMSKTIIEEHCNGKISVHNDKDGAVFKIIIKDEDI